MPVADVAVALIMAQVQSGSISKARRAQLKKAAVIMMHYASAGRRVSRSRLAAVAKLVRLGERPKCWMVDPQGRLILAFHS